MNIQCASLSSEMFRVAELCFMVNLDLCRHYSVEICWSVGTFMWIRYVAWCISPFILLEGMSTLLYFGDSRVCFSWFFLLFLTPLMVGFSHRYSRVSTAFIISLFLLNLSDSPLYIVRELWLHVFKNHFVVAFHSVVDREQRPAILLQISLFLFISCCVT